MRFATVTALLVLLCVIFMWDNDLKADEPTILKATVEIQTNSLYAFSVTIVHPDTGWSHYIDKWDIIGPDDKVLATRILYHPHGNNEPFTRSLANVSVPIGETSVRVKAHCSVDGPAKSVFEVELPPR